MHHIPRSQSVVHTVCTRALWRKFTSSLLYVELKFLLGPSVVLSGTNGWHLYNLEPFDLVRSRLPYAATGNLMQHYEDTEYLELFRMQDSSQL